MFRESIFLTLCEISGSKSHYKDQRCIEEVSVSLAAVKETSTDAEVAPFFLKLDGLKPFLTGRDILQSFWCVITNTLWLFLTIKYTLQVHFI